MPLYHTYISHTISYIMYISNYATIPLIYISHTISYINIVVISQSPDVTKANFFSFNRSSSIQESNAWILIFGSVT